jgi:hypothetical protein
MGNETWEGIATRGIPGTKPAGGNIPHIQNSAWYADADGKPDGLGPLQVGSTVPPAPEPPEALRAPWYFRQKDVPANTNTPSYQKVVFPPSPFQPGYTSDPNPPATSFGQAGQAPGKWVSGLDANGDPIFGTPPASGTEAQAIALIRTGAALLTALGK